MEKFKCEVELGKIISKGPCLFERNGVIDRNPLCLTRCEYYLKHIAPQKTLKNKTLRSSKRPKIKDVQNCQRKKKISSNTIPLKNVYHLWIKYLKQSEDYKDFCEWWRNRDKTRGDEKFQYSSPKWLSQGANFAMFGDIHSRTFSFSKWWKNFNIEDQHKPILSGPDLFKQFQATCYIFQKLKHRNLTPDEIMHLLSKWIDRDIIKVNFSGNSFPKIRKALNNFVQSKKNPVMKKEDISIRRYWKPSTAHIKLDELERHLRVYVQYKRGMKISEIIKTDPFYKDHDEDNRKRLAYMDIEKAERIIKNVELGIFPGKYEKEVKEKIF